MSQRSTVAIVGRPNVGKSTLFNRLLKSRKALVEDIPGVTRDRIYGTLEWDGRSCNLIDTGGLDPKDPSSLKKSIRQQVEVAMLEADAILIVVDARSGPTGLDADIIQLVRPLGKPVALVVNKADNQKQELLAGEFYRYGLEPVFAVSASHGRGVGELLDWMEQVLSFPEDKEVEDAGREAIRITFCGRPNAGKSSMVNRILGQQRMLVDDRAGTTMDAVEVPFSRRKKDFILVDTAGLRRKRSIDDQLEKLAVHHAITAMEASHVVVLVCDASLGIHDQDAKLAQLAMERGRGLIIALNKWDLIPDPATRKKAKTQVQETLRFVPWAQVVPTSALDGRGLGVICEKAVQAHAAWNRRVSTGELNRFLQEAVELHHPPMAGRRPLKFYYMSQPQIRPPVFVIHANRKSVPEDYQRYLTNRLREVFSFVGTPVRLVVRSSHGDKEGTR